MKLTLILFTTLTLSACASVGAKDATELKPSPCACLEIRNHANG